MSLAHRIIPVVLKRGSAAVKGKRFNSWRSVGMAAQQCTVHAARQVDELALFDIAATPNESSPDFPLVRKLSEALYSPLTVGGGVRTVEHVRELLLAGADKVAIATGLLDDDTLLSRCVNTFGSQAIVAVIDHYENRVAHACGKKITEQRADEWALWCAVNGAGEILLNSVDRDGAMEGYDLKLLERVASTLNVPVIACGGAGTYEHLREGIAAGASAVAAGSMFLFTEATPRGAAEYLHQHGIEVRL